MAVLGDCGTFRRRSLPGRSPCYGPLGCSVTLVPNSRVPEMTHCNQSNELTPPSFLPCLELVFWFPFCCDKNTLTKRNLGEEWVYFSLYYPTHSPLLRSQGRNSRWELTAEALEGHCLLAHSRAHVIQPRTTCLETVQFIVGCPHQSTI